jgi:hypothetical protein
MHASVYPPERVQVMIRAFDAAWAHLAQRKDVAAHAEAIRLRLADAIFAEAEQITDQNALTKAALSRIALA